MYYSDDSDQLPPLPDCGPRDGRHGVDCDESYDPYPETRMGVGSVNALTVSMEDARLHLTALVGRVEQGDQVIITRDGIPVARLVSVVPTAGSEPGDFSAVEPVTAVPAMPALGRHKPKEPSIYIDHGAHLLELPDGGPRDGRHGVDRDRGFTPSDS
ncbi:MULTISPECIES: type II toxin-antitoxin system prevent-host-death family antitoxin [unclassified Salinibacterium]|uniref:type II toxin-antitoxin system Phd/YefM family antitoxin n=1 Tax=unclassified Salinibacterium TaxID=2632331 RepID=UPI00141E50FF|nr:MULTISPECIES: type II toxin-antitoxin system prevent-host-death family antitoxin [unclassified Salinibacterium]